MIINTSQGDIEVVGDVKEFKTSIDPKNLEFITTLLSSNLYSDPEQSFIREIVSNAWDSHVEAGTTNIPVIVKFKNSCGDRSVTIRDFGVGLSPERFQEVYCNIGSSTKRESNEFIGGFGIGKYSSLACSNTVYITSYYEGMAYYYVMVKSGNTITTNQLMEKPTEEKNGVEVTIKNIPSLEPYNKALQYITFFPNIYIDGAANAVTINEAKLKRFTNFAAASINIPSKLLLGNVLYPLQSYHLARDVRGFIDNIEGTGIVIKFDVGEINITPNRESIIYSSDTIKKIENRVRAANKELDALINKKISQDYSDIIEYYNALSGVVGYEPVSDSIINYGGYRVYPISMLTSSITYKGVDLRSEINVLKNILNVYLPNFKGAVYSDKIYTKNMPWEIMGHDRVKCPKLLILNTGNRLVPAAKSFLKENYDKYGVMSDISPVEFSNYIKNTLSLSDNIQHLDFMLSGVYESMMKNATRLNLDSDPAYLQYKADIVANRPTDTKDIRETILYVWNDRSWKTKRTFKKFSQAVSYIKGLKKGVILTNMSGDENLFSTIANLKHYAFIKARKDIVADLKSLNMSCIVDIDWLVNKDPMLSIVATIMKHFPNGMTNLGIPALSYNLPEDIMKEFDRLMNIDCRYRESHIYRALVNRVNPAVDPYTEYLCLKLKNYLEKHNQVSNIVSLGGISNNDITTAIVIKTKAYRVSNWAYNRVKNNKVLNILCKK